MELTITEITDMGVGNRCVACWDPSAKRMVRPLPDGHHWSSATVNQMALTPGSIIDVTHNNKTHGGDYPHLTEDFEVAQSATKAVSRRLTSWFGNDAPDTSASVVDGFGGKVKYAKEWRGTKQGVYVPRNTVCPSLIGLNINVNNLELLVPFDKLKVRLYDGDASYELPVSSHALHMAFGNGGLAAAKKVLPRTGVVHVRLGLARAYDRYPENCFLMLNGVNW